VVCFARKPLFKPLLNIQGVKEMGIGWPQFCVGTAIALLTSCVPVQDQGTQPVASPEAIAVVDGNVTILRRGQFQSAEQPTRGQLQIVTHPGKTARELKLSADFRTKKGPTLKLILHSSPDLLTTLRPPNYPLKAKDYIVLKPLTSQRGEQTYPIPDTLNLDDYGSVAIWCEKFNATFGVATLEK
jgi:hypothetical protein